MAKGRVSGKQLLKLGKAEASFLEFVEKYFYVLILVVATLIGLAMRIKLLPLESRDFTNFYAHWLEQIRGNGGLAGLGTPAGNYTAPFQLVVTLLDALPVPDVAIFKIPGVVCDVAMAVASALLAADLSSPRAVSANARLRFSLAYAVVFMAPAVVLNASAWAQIESIWVAPCLFTLWFLNRDRPLAAFVCFGIALSVKFQAVFLLPYLMYDYFRRRSYSILLFLAIPATMVLVMVPFMFVGRSPYEIFTTYLGQTKQFAYMTMNFPNLWHLLAEGEAMHTSYGFLHTVGVFAAVSVLGVLFSALVVRKVEITRRNTLMIAIMFSYATVYVLTGMHDRYGFLYEVLLLILAIADTRFAPFAVAAQAIVMFPYGHYLFAADVPDWRTLSLLNGACLVAYIALAFRWFDRAADAPEEETRAELA